MYISWQSACLKSTISAALLLLQTLATNGRSEHVAMDGWNGLKKHHVGTFEALPIFFTMVARVKKNA